MASSPDTLTQQIIPAQANPSRRQAGGDAVFSPLEWLVIAIARRDTMASIRRPGRLAVALGSLFGSASTPSLADPRLEELRYAAVMAWHGHHPDEEGRQRFEEAGFDAKQRELLYRSVARDLGGTMEAVVYQDDATLPAAYRSAGLH